MLLDEIKWDRRDAYASSTVKLDFPLYGASVRLFRVDTPAGDWHYSLYCVESDLKRKPPHYEDLDALELQAVLFHLSNPEGNSP